MDISTFKKVVFEAARQLNAVVCNVTEPDVTPNFFVAEIRHLGKQKFVLASLNNDWALCSRYSFIDCELEFIDDDELAKSIECQTGIHVYSQEQLLSPFKKRPYFSEHDIQYWKPKTLGEGLFNWWD